VCEARVHPCPILSFQVEAQPKSRFSGIQCWSEAEVPRQIGGIGRSSFLQDSRRDPLSPAGYARFPTHMLYERYGLFKIPTTAPWKNAHALV